MPTGIPLFGGESTWDANDWVASDDRVRGGRSHSFLKINDDAATFCGHLDIETLGGAGFASQRTTGEDRHWDLSRCNAIELLIDATHSDDKRYTFNLKDELLPVNPENGREQSTVSWEYDFKVTKGTGEPESPNLVQILIPWCKLTPTYRGREKDPGRSLRLADIRRMSIMMRSFFGDQKGDFSLRIISITATYTGEACDGVECAATSASSESSSLRDPKQPQPLPSEAEPKGIWERLLSMCNKL